ncbi:hypothetical protein Tco_1275378 [Tanacetum coccineum]
MMRLIKVSSPDGNYLVVYKVNGHFRAFNYLMEVLHIFYRQDLFHLYDLVMKQYSKITPEDIELILWGDLKIMMESSTEENDQELKDGTVIYMLVERRYPLSKELLQQMIDLGLEVKEESNVALQLNYLKEQTLCKLKVKIYSVKRSNTTDSNQSSVCAEMGTYNQVIPPNRVSNQMAPPGFAPMQNSQNRFNQNQGQGNNINRGNNFHGNQGFQVPNNDAPNFQNQGFQNQPFQVPNNQVQQGIPNEFSSYMKSNESMMRNMQTQINELRGNFSKQKESLRRNLNNDMWSILGSFFQNHALTSGTLLSNTIPNPKGEMKAITTRSGVAYEGPSIPTNPSPKKVVEQETEETTDKEQTNFQGSTAHIQPLVIPIPIPEPDVPKTLPKPNISYPSRLNDQKLREKATNQREKFFQIFQDLYFDISFVDALLLMPKFSSTIKSFLTNKDKLFELAKIPLNENCSAMLLKKLPEKLGDPDKFLIPCDFPGIDILLEDCRALIDVYGEEITLQVNKKAVTFNINQTTRYSSTYDDMSVNQIDVINVACEKYALEVLGFSNNSTGGNPTPTFEPIISDSSLSLTPFEGSDLILEEIEAYLKDDSISPKINHADFDLEGDLRLIKELLNNDPSSPFPVSHNPISSSTTSSSSPSLTPVETSDVLLEEFADELALLEPFPPRIGDNDYDLEGDIFLLEKFLNDDPSSPLPPKEHNFGKLKMIKSSIDDFSSVNVYVEKSMTFSNPLFYSNEDFTSSDDESLPDEDVPKDNVKIYSNPLFEFGDEYTSSEVNPLFDEVLKDIESKDSYVSNLDEPALLVTPLSDANEDECFDPGGVIDEIDTFLDIDISTDIENGDHDSEGDIIYLESFLIDDTIPNLPFEVFLDHDPRSLKDEPDNDDLMTKDKVFNLRIW